MPTNTVSFDVGKEDAHIISKIVTRGLQMAKEAGNPIRNKMSVHMDITACHANGCPLKLQKLLDADDFNFAHDFFGIRRHISRETGKLEGFFLPRFHD